MTKNMYKNHTDRHLNGESKKSMDCLKCGKSFSQFKSLHQHVVQTHADVTPGEIAKLEAAHSKCPVCQKMFRSEDVMKNHMRKHKGNDANIFQPVQDHASQEQGDQDGDSLQAIPEDNPSGNLVIENRDNFHEFFTNKRI